MKITIYNKIGNDYNKTREADERIVNRIIKWFPEKDNNLVADIGAGTGNYSLKIAEKRNTVHALEPSEVMQNQKATHKNIAWFAGFAENIPFDDNTYDSVICILASHHFNNLKKSITEMHRILKKDGKLIFFTADPRQIDGQCWLKTYFKPFDQLACNILPEKNELIKLIESIFQDKALIDDFPLPHDLKDGFFYSAWKYPEKYLSKKFRNGISVFSLLSENIVLKTVGKLRGDLESGEWEKKYHHIKELDLYNGGYFFLIIKKY
jgi:ubiquinone/menaquinone biosynthesis C-methylase UbiE